jgi:hypothetical protein
MMRTNCIRRTSYIIPYCVSNTVKVKKTRRRRQNKYGKIKKICTVKERDGAWYLDYKGIR